MMISGSEHMWRGEQPLRLAGVLLCGSVVFITTSLVWLTLPWANVYWVYSFLALRSLDAESNVVVRSLQRGDVGNEQDQVQLAMIVGRDTEHLDEPEILRAVIETVSENMSDGVDLRSIGVARTSRDGGVPAVRTFDSMIGYKDERYRELGWASARV